MNINPKLAIDLDEVLVPLLRPMAKWYGVQLPTVKHRYLYRDVFNCTEDKAKEILHGFYKSDDFANLQPLPGARHALQKVKSLGWNRVYVVTGRQDVVRKPTELWLETHFPEFFDDVILTNSFTEHEVNKASVCKAIGASMLIDDSFENCRDAQNIGIQALNFIGFDDAVYPWCEPNDISVQDWTTLLSSESNS